MTTPTPDELVLTVARAVADGASADERRAGRQACILLATTLGAPGDPMTWPGTEAATAATSQRPSGAQLLDLAIMKMRAFLDEQDAKVAANAAPSAASSTEATSTPPTAAPRPASPPRPRGPQGVRIPMVGAYTRKP